VVQTVHRSQGVFLSTITSVGRNLEDEFRSAFFFHGYRDLVDSEFFLVPGLGVGIAVVDEAVTGVDSDVFAADEVFWAVEFFLFKGHSWVVSKDGDLRKLHSVNIQRECILSTVNHPNLLYIHCIIREEKVQREEINIPLKRLVIPHDIKAEHMAIMLEELSKASVWMATTKSFLTVFLILLLIGRCDLHVF